jgi:peptidoglycan/LPS O-acetylase OafA/YrhL
MVEKEQIERIFGLDVMRAMAIIMVLSSHILWIYPQNSSMISQFFQLFGFLGVEAFFVLSGFLIGTIFYKLYLKDDFSFKSTIYFLKRRWFRTLPNYYLFLVLNVIVTFIIGYTVDDLWKYLFFLQNFCTTMLPFYTESWSLSVEEFTYIVLPISIVIGSFLFKNKNKKQTYISIVTSLIIVLILAKFIYNQTTTNTTLIQWNVSLKAVVIYRMDSILIGVVFSWMALNYQQFWQKQKVNLAFIGAILLLMMYVGVGFFQLTIENYPLFWNVFYLPITSLTLALFLPILSQWKTTKLPFKKAVVTVSLISYSCYLIHYGIVLQLMKHFIKTDNLAMYQLHIYTLAFLFITFVLSYLNYKFFEKPIMDLRDKK